MDARELMVGDWVFNKHHNKPIKITPYDFFVHGHREDGSQYLIGENFTSGRDLEPIPLTPEILENNGFAEKNVFADSLGFEIFGNKSLSCGLSYVENEGFLFETYKPWTKTADDGSPEDWGYSSQDSIRGIRYVHELQHALRLCGIDKEIVV